jgi:hypothetical protein
MVKELIEKIDLMKLRETMTMGGGRFMVALLILPPN